jgi:hypothetical protein
MLHKLVSLPKESTDSIDSKRVLFMVESVYAFFNQISKVDIEIAEEKTIETPLFKKHFFSRLK